MSSLYVELSSRNANNFWTVRPIFTKFGLYHQPRSRNKVVCRKWEIQKTTWPPTPSWIFTQTWITREVGYRSCCHQILTQAQSRYNRHDSSHFSKSNTPPLKFTHIAIISKMSVRNGRNVAAATRTNCHRKCGLRHSLQWVLINFFICSEWINQRFWRQIKYN